MEMHNRNQSDLLPYEKLAILGIDREKADSLPMEVKEKLMAGEVTPIMQVSINARNGSIITMPMKLQMTTDKNGAPALLAYPVRAELDRERNKVLNLTQQEAERLARGEVIQKAVNVNGEKTQQYYYITYFHFFNQLIMLCTNYLKYSYYLLLNSHLTMFYS